MTARERTKSGDRYFKNMINSIPLPLVIKYP